MRIILAIIAVLIIIFIVVIKSNNPDRVKHVYSTDNTIRQTKNDEKKQDSVSNNFSIPAFADNEEGKLAKLGFELITETYAHIGPHSAKPITGNKMTCSNCHLNAGTKPFAAPYIGLPGVFPVYIGREGKIESLEERINGCLERSMNGKAIAASSNEMRAIVTYIKHISKNVPIGLRLKGQGFVAFKAPARAADPKQGAIVYQQNCKTCHGSEGQGQKGVSGNKEGGYIFPPLWGNDSYNDGAGMTRLLTAAKFIKGNMPLGVTYEKPLLTDEAAYDVAAYINSFKRPIKSNKQKDYPDLSKKPQDCPYPPYADSLTIIQHKYGPFVAKEK